MKLKEGRYYKTRLGCKVGPMTMDEYGLFRSPDRPVSHEFWYLNGRYSHEEETSLDLLEEFIPPPETREFYARRFIVDPDSYIDSSEDWETLVPELLAVGDYEHLSVNERHHYMKAKLIYLGSEEWNLLELAKNPLDSAPKPGHNDLPPAVEGLPDDQN